MQLSHHHNRLTQHHYSLYIANWQRIILPIPLNHYLYHDNFFETIELRTFTHYNTLLLFHVIIWLFGGCISVPNLRWPSFYIIILHHVITYHPVLRLLVYDIHIYIFLYSMHAILFTLKNLEIHRKRTWRSLILYFFKEKREKEKHKSSPQWKIQSIVEIDNGQERYTAPMKHILNHQSNIQNFQFHNSNIP